MTSTLVVNTLMLFVSTKIIPKFSFHVLNFILIGADIADDSSYHVLSIGLSLLLYIALHSKTQRSLPLLNQISIIIFLVHQFLNWW